MEYFSQLNEEQIKQLAQRFGTPLFLIDEAGVTQRFLSFKQAIYQYYKNSLIAISYKTNLVKGLLALLHTHGAHAEVVSGNEYNIAKALIHSGQHIIFNGPMKTEEELTQAILDNAMINCDNEDEIDRLEQIAKKLNKHIKIGIRVFFPGNQTWSRFGFEVKDSIATLIHRIKNSSYLVLAGLHTHIGTNIRQLDHFTSLSQCLNSFALRLHQEFQIKLEWIDLGGGLAGITPRKTDKSLRPLPLPELNDYAAAIIAPLLPYLKARNNEVLLIFEPGRTLFEAYGALLTRVVGRRPLFESTVGYICDAGINALSTSYEYDFPVKAFSNATTLTMSTLFGPTCNQADQLHSPLLLPTLKPDDLLLFYGVGSYCMAFSYSFIRYRPGVVLWRQHHEPTWLRLPEDQAHYERLEQMPYQSEQQVHLA